MRSGFVGVCGCFDPHQQKKGTISFFGFNISISFSIGRSKHSSSDLSATQKKTTVSQGLLALSVSFTQIFHVFVCDTLHVCHVTHTYVRTYKMKSSSYIRMPKTIYASTE